MVCVLPDPFQLIQLYRYLAAAIRASRVFLALSFSDFSHISCVYFREIFISNESLYHSAGGTVDCSTHCIRNYQYYDVIQRQIRQC